MNVLTSIKSWFNRGQDFSGRQDLEQEVGYLSESIARLQLELENEGYRRLTVTSNQEFDRAHLGTLVELNLVMALKNPIINRAVGVQADYVFGRGVSFIAAHPMVQAVLDEHIAYHGNQKILYAHDSMARQERELSLKGNLFFALYTNRRTGRVIVRDLDVLEISDIIVNPNDYHDEWFYKRTWSDGNGVAHITYHPSISVSKRTAYLPSAYRDGEIDWNAPVHHMGPNKYGRMRFAIPEIYPSIDWALAYKKFLENWATIMQAYARMAMRISGLSGRKQVGAAKSQLQTSIGLTNPLETNPSATAGSTGLFGRGVSIEPVKTAGSTTPAKEGQPLLNMAAAGIGLPNTFFGDASVGNHATATTLDRPTELKMVARQKLWASAFNTILDYVILQSASAPMGLLSDQGASIEISVDPFTDERVPVITMPNNTLLYYGVVGKPISTHVRVKFPELLERNVTDRVRALVNALTLFGKPLMDIVPDKRLVCRMLLEALNFDNIEQVLPGFEEMWTKNQKSKDGKPVDPIIIPPAPLTPAGGAEDPSQGGDVGKNG